MEESRPYRFKISLRLRHPQTELSACSSEFGLEPFRQWSSGQERTSPRGKPLAGVWDDSYWTTPLEILSDEDLEDALSRIGQWLEGHASFLSKHLASGGSASLFIGFFLEGFNSGFSLDPSLLAKYSSLGVALDFDVYGPDDSPDAP
ncbi:DUF4279 domain-containing protein [Aerolutibacter daejeonensis]|uniref:DUF4279 domain-containing protein n=1 Tax=Aerolutibacter daejeonensis TaxID=346181 RepID=UPI0012EB1F1C